MQTALERRAKRRVFGPPHTCYVETAPGTDDGAVREITEIASDPIVPANRELVLDRPRGMLVLRNADYRRLLELCLRAQTICDVWMIIHQETVEKVRALEAELAKVPADLFFAPGSTVALRVDSVASTVYHEGLIRSAASKALSVHGISVDEEESAVGRLSVSLLHDTLRVSVSLAGQPLWKRGYRAGFGTPAPLREDLAQYALRTAFPSQGGKPPFLLVPFAGSGTFGIEAACYAYRLPSFIFGRTFGFETFPFGVPKAFEYAKAKLVERSAGRVTDIGHMEGVLIDRSSAACDECTANIARVAQSAEKAGMAAPLVATARQEDAFAGPWSVYVPRGAEVFLPLNPPYGLRHASEDVDRLYARIGASIRELAGACRLSGVCLCPTETTWRTVAADAKAAGLSTHVNHIGQGGLDIRVLSFRPAGRPS